MRQYPSDIAFTSTVKAFQTEKGSRMSYLDMEHRGGWQTTVTSDLKSFLIELDMFYHRAIAGSIRDLEAMLEDSAQKVNLDGDLSLSSG